MLGDWTRISINLLDVKGQPGESRPSDRETLQLRCSYLQLANCSDMIHGSHSVSLCLLFLASLLLFSAGSRLVCALRQRSCLTVSSSPRHVCLLEAGLIKQTASIITLLPRVINLFVLQPRWNRLSKMFLVSQLVRKGLSMRCSPNDRYAFLR